MVEKDNQICNNVIPLIRSPLMMTSHAESVENYRDDDGDARGGKGSLLIGRWSPDTMAAFIVIGSMTIMSSLAYVTALGIHELGIGALILR